MKRINMKLKYKINNRSIRFLKISLLMLVVFATSCSDEKECGYETCNFDRSNTELSGWTVATCHGNGINPVGVIYDTRLNSSAPLGDDWGSILDPTPPSSPKAIHPASWNSNNLGQIFGIAIDDSENVFLATSGIYNQLGYSYDNGAKSATIYKSSSPTWNATPFVNLPTSSGNLNDIGNIAYDKLNNQLFATNLEDGKIYRITNLNNSTGTIAETYDPWAQEASPSPIGEVSPDEQIWGLGVNYEEGKVKVYFPRVTTNNTTREIYSITLDSNGNFPSSGSEINEITNIPGTQKVISDIAFSSDFNKMLVSERGQYHNAKVVSYTRSSGSWNFNRQYFVGGLYTANGENSAGGVDFYNTELNGNINENCDESFWASGNYMEAVNYTGKIYGLQGISYSGNLASNAVPVSTANQSTDIFIDLDPRTNAKGGIGDVEVFDANECFDPCNY